MKTKTYRLRSRLGFTLFVAMILIGITFTFNTIVGLNDANSDTQQTYQEITVYAGDTIWDIVDSYIDDNSDIRKAVHKVCQVNQISADQLYEGQTLLIPDDL